MKARTLPPEPVTRPPRLPMWVPNLDADEKLFTDGDTFIVAVGVRNLKTKTRYWDIDKIRVTCCSETPVEFVHADSGEAWDKWEWGDVEFYMPLVRDDE